jgi:hypothetical protein
MPTRTSPSLPTKIILAAKRLYHYYSTPGRTVGS